MVSTIPSSSPPQFSKPITNKGMVIPPLDLKRFKGSFKHFCSVKGLVLDQEPLRVGGKELNLHSLHEKVIAHCGYEIAEKTPDFWMKIGEELRLIHPRDVTSARLEVTDRLAAIYKRCLEQFDTIYVISFVQEVQHRMAQDKTIG
ncbi:hypothetical protein BJ322DRAFT_1105382 [Thelephora terrestris]|uniref:ARID domain-containing protein n=1 Tax=Thelephora terrestris TaxID=56493 RepID=A0A9P6HNV6_9AGAM|nr:hypothetical protein BJ322DRAFT_1105382 [Thelephora terrestris]